jgi:Major Facilitator Superfamily
VHATIAFSAPSAPGLAGALVPCALVGLGGLFAGVTGPLLSTFVPPLVRDALGEHRAAIGAVLAIDNVLLLLLVPWAGAVSDRTSARGKGRLHVVLAGFVLAASGMALFPASSAFGIAGVISAIVVLYMGINVQRSSAQALVADLVPSGYRSLAAGSVTFQMCLGAIVLLMLGRVLGMQTAFLIASGAVLAIAAAFALGLREPEGMDSPSADPTSRRLLDAAWFAVRGIVPGMRAKILLHRAPMLLRDVKDEIPEHLPPEPDTALDGAGPEQQRHLVTVLVPEVTWIQVQQPPVDPFRPLHASPFVRPETGESGMVQQGRHGRHLLPGVLTAVAGNPVVPPALVVGCLPAGGLLDPAVCEHLLDRAVQRAGAQSDPAVAALGDVIKARTSATCAATGRQT